MKTSTTLAFSFQDSFGKQEMIFNEHRWGVREVVKLSSGSISTQKTIRIILSLHSHFEFEHIPVIKLFVNVLA